MFFECFGEDEYVVHIDTHPALSDFIPKYIVHHGLKRRWRVCQSKEHHQCSKCSLPLITFFDANVVVPPANVHFGKVFRVGQFVN
ncbi:hypothetical protein AMATHDRAFT_158176 [Amanita thiersii Skay4041]|uniref:Uncharacterized protein n=1 Tax=Amanita thiersii Skay4041 TaxID=703135 RepID=A0A2A9ND99_9AGAR|nr:hypothetical protein AMATHDRAFT_158176 [Amanita thiersii Skay4041]